jgi:hypothetical protein
LLVHALQAAVSVPQPVTQLSAVRHSATAPHESQIAWQLVVKHAPH